MAAEETVIEQGSASIVVAAHGLVGITVSIVDRRTGLAREEVRLPYPREGYGGHEIVLSPRQHYAALFLYSGQSEVGYELFALGHGLQHLGGLPYVYGEGDRPVFSPDERWLVMIWETYFDWWSEAAAAARAGTHVVDWGEIAVQELPHGPIECVPIRARIPPGWQPEASSWTAPTDLRFASPHELRVRTPWGTEPAIPFPLPPDPVIEL